MIAIPIEGYLSTSESLGPSPASATSRYFYNVVKDSGESIVLLSASRSRSEAEQWCHREGITGWHVLVCREDAVDIWPIWKVGAVERMVGLGNRVSLYVDSDPATVAKVARMGVSCLLQVDAFKVPGRVTLPGSVDNPSYTPWDVLEQEILANRDESARIRSTGVTETIE